MDPGLNYPVPRNLTSSDSQFTQPTMIESANMNGFNGESWSDLRTYLDPLFAKLNIPAWRKNEILLTLAAADVFSVEVLEELSSEDFSSVGLTKVFRTHLQRFMADDGKSSDGNVTCKLSRRCKEIPVACSNELKVLNTIVTDSPENADYRSTNDEINSNDIYSPHTSSLEPSESPSKDYKRRNSRPSKAVLDPLPAATLTTTNDFEGGNEWSRASSCSVDALVNDSSNPEEPNEVGNQLSEAEAMTCNDSGTSSNKYYKLSRTQRRNATLSIKNRWKIVATTMIEEIGCPEISTHGFRIRWEFSDMQWRAVVRLSNGSDAQHTEPPLDFTEHEVREALKRTAKWVHEYNCRPRIKGQISESEYKYKKNSQSEDDTNLEPACLLADLVGLDHKPDLSVDVNHQLEDDLLTVNNSEKLSTAPLGQIQTATITKVCERRALMRYSSVTDTCGMWKAEIQLEDGSRRSFQRSLKIYSELQARQDVTSWVVKRCLEWSISHFRLRESCSAKIDLMIPVDESKANVESIMALIDRKLRRPKKKRLLLSQDMKCEDRANDSWWPSKCAMPMQLIDTKCNEMKLENLSEIEKSFEAALMETPARESISENYVNANSVTSTTRITSSHSPTPTQPMFQVAKADLPSNAATPILYPCDESCSCSISANSEVNLLKVTDLENYTDLVLHHSASLLCFLGSFSEGEVYVIGKMLGYCSHFHLELAELYPILSQAQFLWRHKLNSGYENCTIKHRTATCVLEFLDALWHILQRLMQCTDRFDEFEKSEFNKNRDKKKELQKITFLLFHLRMKFKEIEGVFIEDLPRVDLSADDSQVLRSSIISTFNEILKLTAGPRELLL